MAARLLLVAGLALGLAALAAPRALAIQEARSEPVSGDLLWTLAEEPPFYDQRVRLAFAVKIDHAAVMTDAGLWPEHQLFPSVPDDRFFIQKAGIEADAPLLLAAAGIDPATVTEIGTCGVWVAPPPVGGGALTIEDRRAAATAFGEAFRAAGAELGITIGPCVLVDDLASAHVLLWSVDDVAPAIPQRDEPTLLAFPGFPPGAQPGGTGGGGGLAPPSSGSAGLTHHHETAAVDVLLFAALALALPLAARSVTSQGPR